MRIFLSALLLTASVSAPSLAHAPASAPARTHAAYNVQETDLGTLLDDPVAKAILVKYLPDVVSNPQVDMGRSLTLAQLQQYAGDQITDDKLAKIQADLDAAKPN